MYQNHVVPSGSGSEAVIAENGTSDKGGSMDSDKLDGKSFQLTTLREMVQSSSAQNLPTLSSMEAGNASSSHIEKVLSRQYLSMHSVTSTGNGGNEDEEQALPPGAKIVVQDSTIRSIRKIRHVMSRMSFNGGSSRIAPVVDSNSMFCTSAEIANMSGSMDSELEAALFGKPTDATTDS